MPKAKTAPAAILADREYAGDDSLALARILNSLLTEPLIPDDLIAVIYPRLCQLMELGSGRDNDFTDEALAQGLRKTWAERQTVCESERRSLETRRVLAQAIRAIQVPSNKCPKPIFDRLKKGVSDLYNGLNAEQQGQLDTIEEQTSDISLEYNDLLLSFMAETA